MNLVKQDGVLMKLEERQGASNRQRAGFQESGNPVFESGAHTFQLGHPKPAT